MERIKYPRTYHLPYSQSKTDNDKTLPNDDQFKGMEVVVTIKMDGENTTIYPDGYIHARSLDGYGKPWQKYIRMNNYWSYKIPTGWRVCGENLEACHSIAYSFKSPSEYFQIFGIYDEDNICLAWDEVEDFCRPGMITINGLIHVPVIYRGKYDKDTILKTFNEYCKSVAPQEVEGFVVRNAASFPYSEFKNNVAKYVRANHVQTDKHWRKNWIKNVLQ